MKSIYNWLTLSLLRTSIMKFVRLRLFFPYSVKSHALPPLGRVITLLELVGGLVRPFFFQHNRTERLENWVSARMNHFTNNPRAKFNLLWKPNSKTWQIIHTTYACLLREGEEKEYNTQVRKWTKLLQWII